MISFRSRGQEYAITIGIWLFSIDIFLKVANWIYLFLKEGDMNNWDWVAVGTCISALAILLTVIGLLIVHLNNESDKKYKRSETYLNQIKEYHSKAITFFSYESNDNIRWHQAIEVLKVVDNLKNQLTEEAHKHIYLSDFVLIGFEIIKVIKRIEDFKFFYGIEEYQHTDSNSLYNMAFSPEMKYCYRISPDSLLSLCLFVDKVSRVHYDLNENQSPHDKIYSSQYVTTPIHIIKGNNISELTKKNMKVVLDYINDFEQHQIQVSSNTPLVSDTI